MNFQDVFDTKARVPVDDESNRLLQEEPFGVYTGLGMVALTEQLLLPRLQHIENVFMTSRNIPIRHAIKVADDNPNERIYFTDICIKHDDNSDAAGKLVTKPPLFRLKIQMGIIFRSPF